MVNQADNDYYEQRKERRRFNEAQSTHLRQAFVFNSLQTRHNRMELAEKIGSDPLSVRIWSQNKRQQVKLQREREEAQAAALVRNRVNEAIYRKRQLEDVA
jgi:Homeodomain